MNDDQLLLASAYLDGDVDGAERAQAEADVEVMAEVARMRAVREAVRAVEGPDPGRREQALAAALATLADEPAPVRAPPGPTRGSARTRRTPWAGVIAAAAALVLVVGAGIVLRGTSAGDDDDAASVATADERTGDASLSAADQAPAETTRAEAPAAAGEAEGATEDGGSPSATSTSSAGASEVTESGDAPQTQVAEALPELASPGDLVAFATSRGTRPYEGVAPSCTSDGTFLGPVVYAGAPAEVFLVGTAVTALEATSCVVLATVER